MTRRNWWAIVALCVSAALAQDSGETKPPRLIQFRTAPNFPDLARRMKLKGTVQLEALVRHDGTVKELRAGRASSARRSRDQGSDALALQARPARKPGNCARRFRRL